MADAGKVSDDEMLQDLQGDKEVCKCSYSYYI